MSTETETPALPPPLVDEHVRAARWPMPEAVQVALEEAEALREVKSPADYEYAVGLAKDLTQARKAAETFYKPLKQRFDRLKALVLGAENEDVLALAGASQRCVKLANAWADRERERERAERERLEREAVERAEAERKAQVARLEAAAERVPDRAVAEAIRTEAQQLADAQLATPKVELQSAVPAVPGFVPSRVTYSARVDGDAALRQLVRAIAGPEIARDIRAALASGTTYADALDAVLASLEANPVPLDAVVPNVVRLNRAAVDQREALRWPGVTVLRNNAPVVRG